MACVAFATIAVWITVTFITRPESMETLIRFYKKVGPGGPGWKPVAEKAKGVVTDKKLAYSFLAAICATGIVYFTLPAVGLIIFKRYVEGLSCFGGAAICGLATYLIIKFKRLEILGSPGDQN